VALTVCACGQVVVMEDGVAVAHACPVTTCRRCGCYTGPGIALCAACRPLAARSHAPLFSMNLHATARPPYEVAEAPIPAADGEPFDEVAE
jgi:hypothetical protein